MTYVGSGTVSLCLEPNNLACFATILDKLIVISLPQISVEKEDI